MLWAGLGVTHADPIVYCNTITLAVPGPTSLVTSEDEGALSCQRKLQRFHSSIHLDQEDCFQYLRQENKRASSIFCLSQKPEKYIYPIDFLCTAQVSERDSVFCDLLIHCSVT